MVLIVRVVALAVATLGRTSRALFGVGSHSAPRRPMVTLVMLLAISGCGGTSLPSQTVVSQGVVVGNGRADNGATMLMNMTGKHEIRNVSEATAAKERANRTELATVPLFKELGRPDLSERERADKEREIDRLREQYKREMDPVDAFYKELERKGKEYERALERKDPEIERMREEMRRILERKGKDERKEIRRVQEEAKRRLKELAGKSR